MPDLAPRALPDAPRYAGWAIALLVLGWLITIVSGLCTGVVVMGTAFGGSSGGYASGIFVAALIFGGVPFLIGVALIVAMRKWGKRKPLAPPSPNIFS